MLGRMGDDQHDPHDLSGDDSMAEGADASSEQRSTSDSSTPLERGTDIALRSMMRRR
jgi:hypothetical protein